MATNTYVALKTSVVTGSPASTVLLDNIPSGYTDLVLVVQGRFDSANQIREFRLRFNGDTGTNYSSTRMIGDGSSASSDRLSNFSNMRFGVFPAATATSGILGTAICHIQNYANTSVYKTVLNRTSDPQGWVVEAVGLWRNTAAITSVEVAISETQTGNWIVGSTFTIYGIAAEGALAKATGGAIYSDSQYWYHAFAASGTFTPTQSLTADILVVAGGGAGNDGGGGAGGLLTFASEALSATGYTVTVGGGGSGASNGTNSSFGALTAAVGGGKGGIYNATAAGNGGSGGGAARVSGSYGTATSGQGYRGGSASVGSGNAAGGGGGAGAIGGDNSGATGGAGGIGATSAFINAIGAAVNVGETISGTTYFAGGGGAFGGTTAGAAGYGGGGQGSNNSPTVGTDGKPNTGGGGGGRAGSVGWGSGGSGIVIVRYAK